MHAVIPKIAPLTRVGATLVLVLVCASGRPGLAADGLEPIEVLRRNVTRAIAVLEDPRYGDPARRNAQRERLCDIAKEMFDPYLFSKLALASSWERFSASEQEDFVQSFGSYLCRYYLTRLQQHYNDETVEFIGQEFKSSQIATVEVVVQWQNTRVPVEIRMALREEHWKAYDIVLMGVSAVLVYRTQLDDALRTGSPAQIIQSLREKTAFDG